MYSDEHNEALGEPIGGDGGDRGAFKNFLMWDRGYTVVPRLAIAPLSDEIALQWTFGHRWSNRLVMSFMAKIRFAMIVGER